MSRQRTIHFDSDGYRLAGTLHLPETPSPPVVIGCHGLFANRHSPKQIALADVCNKNGFAYLRFDHRGCGDSQGDFDSVTSLSARSSDLYHAVMAMNNHPDTGNLYALFGSSFGGSVVLSHSAEHPVRKMITFAAPISSNTIIQSALENESSDIPARTHLMESLAFDLNRRLHTISNILVVHGEKDELVPLQNAKDIYEKSNFPKKLIVQEDGDHRMSNPAHQSQFASQFISWLLE